MCVCVCVCVCVHTHTYTINRLIINRLAPYPDPPQLHLPSLSPKSLDVINDAGGQGGRGGGGAQSKSSERRGGVGQISADDDGRFKESLAINSMRENDKFNDKF